MELAIAFNVATFSFPAPSRAGNAAAQLSRWIPVNTPTGVADGAASAFVMMSLSTLGTNTAARTVAQHAWSREQFVRAKHVKLGSPGGSASHVRLKRRLADALGAAADVDDEVPVLANDENRVVQRRLERNDLVTGRAQQGQESEPQSRATQSTAPA